MRSRLEAGFAAWLDQMGVPWQYEPTAFASDRGQYLPDFVTELQFGDDTRTAYIEIKPRHPDGDQGEIFTALGPVMGSPRFISELCPELAALGRRMSVVWESDPSAFLLLVWPNIHPDGGWPSALMLAQFEPGDAAAADVDLAVDSGFWAVVRWCRWRDESHALGVLPADLIRELGAEPEDLCDPPATGPWADDYWSVK